MKRIGRLAIMFVVVCHVFLGTAVTALDEGMASSDSSLDHVDSSQVAAVQAQESSSLPLQEVQATPAPMAESTPLPSVKIEENEDPPLVLPSILINRVVAGLSGKTTYEYIELYNPNPHDVFVDSWKVVVLRKDGGTKQELIVHGTVKANGYVLLAGNDSAFDGLEPEFRLSTSPGIVTTGGMIRLVDALGTTVEQLGWGDATTPPSSGLATGEMFDRNYIGIVPWLTGDPAKDFSRKTVPEVPPRTGGYTAYIAPVNRCEGTVISEIAANVATDQQFIELHNTTNSPVVLDECLLQTNRSTTKSFILTGTLGAGEYQAIYVSATELTLTKTTAGTVYLLSSDGKEEIAVSAYDGLGVGTSWSWFGSSDWRQTFLLSPNTGNIWQEFLPCEAGYERNLETGRCRKVAAEELPTPCGTGKYLNPETGRCRSIEVASVLTPCNEGQYRSPETNRCRSVLGVSTSLAPCKENQERNPDTNRCRNIVSNIPEAAFAVEPVAETARVFAGWWALGGIGALAIGRGAWEWRSEMLAGVRKISSFFTSSK